MKRSSLCGWMFTRRYSAINPTNQKIAREMYNYGATDLEIAMMINSTVSTVAQWRETNKLPKGQTRKRGGLPCVRRKQTTRTTYIKNGNTIKYQEMYSQGCDDYEISQAVGVTQQAVYEWRKRYNLPQVM